MNYSCFPSRRQLLARRWLLLVVVLITSFFFSSALHAQIQLAGSVLDEANQAPLVGARVLVQDTRAGAMTDEKGQFAFRSPQVPPFTLVITYFGYDTVELAVANLDKPLRILLRESQFSLNEVKITAAGMAERQRQNPLSVESMSVNAIKETPAANFYDGLGALKGVDLTAASIGFKVVNTRGFNSAAPVRSLQIIDGVDNQSPGLNFSLGNFLGASELDVEQVDLIVGASSAFYGPNAFNGVISMKTKSPFIHQGLSVMAKGGERNMGEFAIRYAHAFKNKYGEERFAFKINAYYLTVNDWEADNLDEVDVADSLQVGVDNPGGYDAVNRYGDENLNRGSRDYTNLSGRLTYPGLGVYHRTGYMEEDLVDYGTENLKLGAALHYRVKPDVELIAASNFGAGTTVLQGDNRYSLRDILFFQHRLELRKENKFFLRAYATHEDAGNSYDAVFTAFRLQTADVDWTRNYRDYWRSRIVPRIKQFNDFPEPQVIIDPVTGGVRVDYDYELADQIMAANQDSILAWHAETRDQADANYAAPGTARFDSLFSLITSRSIYDRGTRLVDRSALFHLHGEYVFEPTWAKIVVGGNGRMYRPVSDGTIFSDTLSITERELPDGSVARDSVRTTITNWEAGVYAGVERKLMDERLKLNATLRLDKNQNFPLLASPALSAVYKLNETDILRFSFSAAIRNPTLSDQYLFYNVGRAILLGNLDGFNNLITPESFIAFSNSDLDTTKFERFNVAPIRPERVRTFEIGYRSVFWNDRLFLDASYYYSFYQDFIGYNIGIETRFTPGNALPTFIQAYRVAANATDRVTTQGASIGLDYYFPAGYTISGNYSWNVLNTQTDDPIIPAFNTPEHKFNLGTSARDIRILGIDHFGYNLNYKWVSGFLFEGSPQFTGFVPSYGMLDVQTNRYFPQIKTTFKLGASNVLNNRVFQIYGGPRIGRLIYFSALLELGRL